eukprot:1908189-Pyramimonas_sp.AAC.1
MLEGVGAEAARAQEMEFKPETVLVHVEHFYNLYMSLYTSLHLHKLRGKQQLSSGAAAGHHDGALPAAQGDGAERGAHLHAALLHGEGGDDDPQ